MDTVMPDYFDEVIAAVTEEKRRDPEVVLPWSWWKEQAEKHHMTPNAVYTRAKKVGLYAPPDKRPGKTGTSTEHEPAPPTLRREPSPTAADAGRGQAAVREAREETLISASQRPEAAPHTLPTGETPRSMIYATPAASQGNNETVSEGIGDALHGYAQLVEQSTRLQQQVRELTRELISTREENRKLRRALNRLENLAEEMRHVYRVTLINDEDA